MGKRLTQEEFEKRIEEQGNGEYAVIGEYQGANYPVLIKHETCGNEWESRPNDFFHGCRCPNCSYNKMRLTQKEFERRVKKQGNEDYIFLEKYQGNKKPLLIKHKKCGYEWKTKPDNFFRGKRCPLCSGRPKINTRHYIEEIKNLDKNYQVLSEYKSRHKKVKMIHLECNNIFEMSPDAFIRGQRCPHCRQSHGELDIGTFLKNHSINYEFQKRFKDCRDKYTLPFDFYIPTLNCCIEFDGIQHFEPVDYFGGEKAFKEVRRRDGIKTKYCKEKGIKLLRIRYDEDVEEKINSILKKSKA